MCDRLEELARRLVALGPKAAHVSASETHEITEWVCDVVAKLRSGELRFKENGAKRIDHFEISDAAVTVLRKAMDGLSKIKEDAETTIGAIDDEVANVTRQFKREGIDI